MEDQSFCDKVALPKQVERAKNRDRMVFGASANVGRVDRQLGAEYDGIGKRGSMLSPISRCEV
jgi:hypothetical protein